ncbi:BglG family transcription antiterminator [Aerococcaceae bacterium NML130460]|nr:BglG family transcription antiterminator [Aerococcaceae bacterium NML130460]
MIDNGSLKLLLDILENPAMKVDNFIETNALTFRQLHAKLEQLNYYLVQRGFAEICIQDDFFQYDAQIEAWIMADDFLKGEMIILDEKVRPQLIYLYVFARQTEVSNYHLQWLLKVSKNTAFSDVKQLKEFCLKHHIQFVYTRQKGYHLKGTEMDKRKLAIMCLNQLMELPLGHKIVAYMIESWGEAANIQEHFEDIRHILVSGNLLVPRSRLEAMSIFCRLLMMRHVDEVEFTEQQYQLLKASQLRRIAQQICERLSLDSEEEVLYLTAHLLAIVEGNALDECVGTIEPYAIQMIQYIERKLAISFDQRLDLQKGLLQHLLPAYYRIVFDIPINNPLLEQIMKDYRFLFDVVQQSLIPLEQLLDKAIPLSEVAYLTMFFGGRLRNRARNKRQLHARVICPNGISASHMLKAQLRELFPDFLWSVDSHLNQQTAGDADMIFSTIFIKADVPVYVTKPLLSVYEKNYLIDVVNRDFNVQTQKLPTSRDIMAIVQKYVQIELPTQLEKELTDYIHRYTTMERTDDPMLKDLLTEDYIQFDSEVQSWQEAIERSAQPLSQKGHIQSSYIQAIIDRVNEYGPYIHIGKGVAIPHARPEDGVSKLGMSFLKLVNPVQLGGKPEHEVDVFITLAAIDNTTHLAALAELTQILSNKDKLDQLKSAQTTQEVLDLIHTT